VLRIRGFHEGNINIRYFCESWSSKGGLWSCLTHQGVITFDAVRPGAGDPSNPAAGTKT
jgi:hypothetical protein